MTKREYMQHRLALLWLSQLHRYWRADSYDTMKLCWFILNYQEAVIHKMTTMEGWS